jgi:hypothetical protein
MINKVLIWEGPSTLGIACSTLDNKEVNFLCAEQSEDLAIDDLNAVERGCFVL